MKLYRFHFVASVKDFVASLNQLKPGLNVLPLRCFNGWP
jgi:hypothetical protein